MSNIKDKKVYEEFEKFVLEFRNSVIDWIIEDPVGVDNFQRFVKEMMEKYSSQEKLNDKEKVVSDNSVSGDLCDISIENSFK